MNSSITVTDNISSLLQQPIDKNTLILVDLDETLITPASYTGDNSWWHMLIEAEKIAQITRTHRINNKFPTDLWWQALLHAEMQIGLTHAQAVEKNLNLLYQTTQNITVKLMEHTTAKVIQTLQEQGIPIVGLTARSKPLQNNTITQLNSVNIDLTKTALQPTNTNPNAHNLSYHNGIIFCGHLDKGLVLESFFTTTAYIPQKLIFIDDKYKHLAEVEQASIRCNIPTYIGLHYQYPAIELTPSPTTEKSKTQNSLTIN